MAKIEVSEPYSEWLAGRGSKKTDPQFQPQRVATSDYFPKVRIEKETEIGQLAIYSTSRWLAHYDSQ